MSSDNRSVILASVRIWSGKPGPAAVLAAARARLEAGQRGDRLTLAVDLDEPARRDLSDLLGLEWRASQTPITLGMLRNALRKHSVELEDVLVVCAGGPLTDAKAARAAARAASAAVVDRTRTVLRNAGVPDCAVDAMITRRWLGGTGRMEGVAVALARMWPALPAPAGTLLSTLASAVFDHPHALDKNTALGRAAARLIAAGRSPLIAEAGGVDPAAVVLEAEVWRSVWASVGVACDRVSSTVLVLNLPLARTGSGAGVQLPADGKLPADRVQQLCAAASGEPLWLTGRILTPDFTLPAGLCEGVVVRVCENPAVVEAAADEFGEEAPPLVCTYGRPSIAARTLLAALTSAGARLLVSADRDDAGKQILAGLLGEFPTAAEWLPDAVGMYEENRLAALRDDMRPLASSG